MHINLCYEDACRTMCVKEMADSKVGDSSAEVHFAQRLASNEKTIRDRALRKLRKWFEARSSSGKEFSESDFVKLWKGLHYCMWMQDKPLLQEELCDRISRLVHLFKNTETAMLFIKVFFLTEAREWDVIDKWRVDKFMMLVRKMLGQSLMYLRNCNWRPDIMSLFKEIMSSRIMNWADESIPDGLRIHVVDIYLDELKKVGAQQLTPKQVLNFLEPFLQCLPGARKKEIMKRVIAEVFERIIDQSIDDSMEASNGQSMKDDSENEDDDDAEDVPTKRLQFDFEAIADRLFELGSDQACLNRNRGVIYNLVKKFRDLQKDVLKKVKVVPPGVNHPKRLQRERRREKGKYTVIRLEEGKKKRKRKKKSSVGEEEKSQIVEEQDAMSASPKKKKKYDNLKQVDNVTNSEVTDNVDVDFQQHEVGNKSGKNVTKKQQKKNKIMKKCELTTKNSAANQSQTELSDKTSSVEKKKAKKRKKSLTAPDSTSIGEAVKSDSSPRTDVSSAENATLDSDNVKLENIQITDKISKKGKKKQKIPVSDSANCVNSDVTNDNTAVTCPESEEVEIWIPNKKYKGKLKGAYEQKMKQMEEINRKETRNSGMQKSKVTPTSEFASFDKLLKTPPAFVRKAVNKTKKPKTEKLKKQHKVELVCPSSEPTKRRKRVSFDMQKNQAQDFKQSLNFSPSPFKPELKPDQGILKSTPIKIRVKKQQLKGQNSTPKREKNATVSTPVTRRRASDFF